MRVQFKGTQLEWKRTRNDPSEEMSFQFVFEILKCLVDFIVVKVKFCVTLIWYLKVP